MNPGHKTVCRHGKPRSSLQFGPNVTENQRMKASAAFIPIILCLLISFAFPLGAQGKAASAPTTVKTPATSAASATPTDPATPAVSADPALPDTYRTLSLGMTIDAVKEQLLSDGLFGYRGERDVSLLPTLNRSLIETVGSSFIIRSWFQFYEEKLYIMTFNLDSEKVDYYSIYSGLVKKYGEPVSLDPHKAVWGDEKVTLSLERPLTLKYMDAAVFQSLLDSSGADKAVSDLLRETFINEF